MDNRIVKISNVLVEKKFQPLVANLIGLIIGFVCIFSFTTIWVIIGLILLGVCGFNSYDLIFKKHYKIAIDYNDGKDVIHEFDSPEKALEFRDSMMKEMNHIN